VRKQLSAFDKLSALWLGLLAGLLCVRPSSLAREMSEASLTDLGVAPAIAIITPHIYWVVASMLCIYVAAKLINREPAVISIPILLLGCLSIVKMLRAIATDSLSLSEVAMFAAPIFICVVATFSSNWEKLRALLVAAVVFALFNLYALVASEASLWQGRALGVAAHPNHLGHQAALLAIISMSSYAFLTPHVQKLLKYIVVPSLLALCFLSGSRSGWLVLATGLLFLAILNRGQGILLAITVLSMLWVLLVVVGPELGYIAPAENLDRGNTRRDVIATLFAHIEQAPIFGVGVLDDSGTSNAFLSAWAHYGITAFLLLIATYLAAERIALKGFGFQESLRPVAIVVPALAVSALFEGQVLDRYSTMLFIQALVLSVYTTPTEQSYNGTRVNNYEATRTANLEA